MWIKYDVNYYDHELFFNSYIDHVTIHWMPFIQPNAQKTKMNNMKAIYHGVSVKWFHSKHLHNIKLTNFAKRFMYDIYHTFNNECLKTFLV